MAAVHRKKIGSAAHRNLPAHKNLKSQFVRAATGPAAKTAYAVVGTMGLAALAIAIFGPRRFQREILQPMQTKVSDQASQLWADARPLREQIGKLFERASDGKSREKLARGFQSWIGHFRAT
jgi:NAD/NADP transhydrogenase alpha subunit